MAINLMAVLLAALISYIIGWAWYSQSLFGKQWMKLTGVTQKDMDKVMKKQMTGNMLAGRPIKPDNGKPSPLGSVSGGRAAGGSAHKMVGVHRSQVVESAEERDPLHRFQYHS